MSQYQTGTVSVTNGSATVTGSGTLWTSAMEGGVFKVEGVSGDYVIQTVTNSTTITLATTYTGSTDSGVNYQITQDFTPNYEWREVVAGDREWAYHLTQTLRAIDAQVYANQGGLSAEHNIDDPTDDTWQGQTCEAVAGETIAQWDVLCCKDTGSGTKWYVYDPDSTNSDNNTYLPLALAIDAGAADATITITKGPGTVANDGWTAAAGNVGTALFPVTGGVSHTPPSGSGDVIKQIGTLLNITANGRNVWDINFAYPAVVI